MQPLQPEWVDKAVEEKKVPPWEEYFVGPEPILSGVVVCFSQVGLVTAKLSRYMRW